MNNQYFSKLGAMTMNASVMKHLVFDTYKMTFSTVRIMHQSFVTTATPPTGKGGHYDFSAFSALL